MRFTQIQDTNGDQAINLDLTLRKFRTERQGRSEVTVWESNDYSYQLATEPQPADNCWQELQRLDGDQIVLNFGGDILHTDQLNSILQKA